MGMKCFLAPLEVQFLTMGTYCNVQHHGVNHDKSTNQEHRATSCQNILEKTSFVIVFFHGKVNHSSSVHSCQKQ